MQHRTLQRCCKPCNLVDLQEKRLTNSKIVQICVVDVVDVVGVVGVVGVMGVVGVVGVMYIKNKK